jgi:cytochrome oxidase Cu insertion factor (SCO1/SenC/PrrC family)
MHMTAPATAVKPRRGQLILLAVLFFAPLLFAFVVYYGSDWRPLRSTNHGTLIAPARPLSPADFLKGQPGITSDLFRGKWTLAYISDGQCDDACRKTLFFMRQTQQTLGALIPRTQRVWLATDHCCDAGADSSTQPPLIDVDAHGESAAEWLSSFPPDQRASSIFIVDPRGNLMMRYDSSADPRGLREDLKKLLGLSHIG